MALCVKQRGDTKLGSLSSLKADLSLVEQELMSEVSVQVDIEESLDFQKIKVESLKKHRDKLQRALDILEDRTPILEEVAIGASVPVATASPSVAAPPPGPSYPLCSACGNGYMQPAQRITKSGMLVNYMLCSDRGCNNEAYG